MEGVCEAIIGTFYLSSLSIIFLELRKKSSFSH